MRKSVVFVNLYLPLQVTFLQNMIRGLRWHDLANYLLHCFHMVRNNHLHVHRPAWPLVLVVN